MHVYISPENNSYCSAQVNFFFNQYCNDQNFLGSVLALNGLMYFKHENRFNVNSISVYSLMDFS